MKRKEQNEIKRNYLEWDNHNKPERRCVLCLFVFAKVVTTHNDSEEQKEKDAFKYNAIKALMDENDTLEMLNYQEGKRMVYKDNKESSYKMSTMEPVDMDCVKEAIIQLNDEKKIPAKKMAIVERVITDGFIGSGMEDMTANEFMDFLNTFTHVTKTTFYSGRLKKGCLKDWMSITPKTKKKIVLFAEKFIQKYSDLKEAKLQISHKNGIKNGIAEY